MRQPVSQARWDRRTQVDLGNWSIDPWACSSSTISPFRRHPWVSSISVRTLCLQQPTISNTLYQVPGGWQSCLGEALNQKSTLPSCQEEDVDVETINSSGRSSCPSSRPCSWVKKDEMLTPHHLAQEQKDTLQLAGNFAPLFVLKYS